MRSCAAGGKLTVTLDCAAASLPRPTSTKRIAAAAVSATPAIAPRLPTSLSIPSQVIEPEGLYHAKMVNAKLPSQLKAQKCSHFRRAATGKLRLPWLRWGLGGAN